MGAKYGLILGIIILVHHIIVPPIESLLWAQFTVFQVSSVMLPKQTVSIISRAVKRKICLNSIQITVAISWPIPYKNPARKIFWNIGFQFNYNEPFLPSNFYRPPFFQNPFTGARSQADQSQLNDTIIADFSNETTTMHTDAMRMSDEHAIQARDVARQITGRDVTAGELYNSIEDHMESYVNE